jgi:hypothetical protein
LSLAQEIEVNRCDDRSIPYISRIVLSADFIVKKKYVSEMCMQYLYYYNSFDASDNFDIHVPCKAFMCAVCSSTTEPYDSEKMAVDFQGQFVNQAFTRGQPLAYQFENKKTLILEVKEIEGTLFSWKII